MVVKQNDGVVLKGHVQRYDWGKKGKDSLVAQLAHSSRVLKEIEQDPYAELWFGSHPSGPSQTLDGGVFKEELPFLLKVLSVGKALSIQAHPDLELAKECHRQRPDLYKDGNHKPEMAIALTPFEALVGFRPLPETNEALSQYPILQKLTGRKNIMNTNDLKEAFENLMKAKVTEADFDIKHELFQVLKGQYPGDIGCWCVFFLNYVKLQPGEAVFLGPNEPHAYLSGDCIECMANSDNVVRAGLTPKYRDVELLCKMLTYKSHPPKDLILLAKNGLYETPVKEFNVTKYTEADKVIEVKKQAIILVVSGKAKIDNLYLDSGFAIYYGTEKNVEITSSDSFVLFKAESKI